MDFNKKNMAFKFGKLFGFILMYTIFTIILFFILKITKKLPMGWNILYIGNVTLCISLLGVLIKKIIN